MQSFGNNLNVNDTRTGSAMRKSVLNSLGKYKITNKNLLLELSKAFLTCNDGLSDRFPVIGSLQSRRFCSVKLGSINRMLILLLHLTLQL